MLAVVAVDAVLLEDAYPALAVYARGVAVGVPLTFDVPLALYVRGVLGTEADV